MDMQLPWFLATVDKFSECGIPQGTNRVSLDGTMMVIHQHGLTKEQYDCIRPKISIITLTHDECLALMNTLAWSEEVI